MRASAAPSESKSATKSTGKPISARKLAANRANAKKSTGPRTVAGKRRCSKNAVTHGLFCNDTVLPGEDRKLFEQFRDAVLLRLSPQDVVELMIVDRIVIAQWKLRRLNSVEASAHIGLAQDRINQAREELDRRRVERFDEDQLGATIEIQQQLLDAEERSPDVINGIAVSAIHDEAYLERLSRYEQRLELSIHRNLRQLDKMRKQSRRDREAGVADPSSKRCPFVSGEAYENAREVMRSRDQECESRPTTGRGTPSSPCGGTHNSQVTTRKAAPNDKIQITKKFQEDHGQDSNGERGDGAGGNGATHVDWGGTLE